MSEIVLTSGSPDRTREIAASVAALVRPGDVVALSGDLGAGKTCFVQGAAAALGVRGAVQSPTFVIVREYEARIPIRHADVYRLDHIGELIDLGYEELFDPTRVLFIEWGDAVEGELPADRLDVEITGDDERRFVLRAHGSWQERLGALEAAAS